jgi:hypothetical protein
VRCIKRKSRRINILSSYCDILTAVNNNNNNNAMDINKHNYDNNFYYAYKNNNGMDINKYNCDNNDCNYNNYYNYNNYKNKKMDIKK